MEGLGALFWEGRGWGGGLEGAIGTGDLISSIGVLKKFPCFNIAQKEPQSQKIAPTPPKNNSEQFEGTTQ